MRNFIAAVSFGDAIRGRVWDFEDWGLGIWVVAFLGETIADAQLARFKRDPKNKAQVCNVGLWRYSRRIRITSLNR